MHRSLRIIAVMGGFFIVDLTGCFAVVDTADGEETENVVCSTSGCVETASRILKDINPAIEPCDNFYDFACGGYQASTPIADGENIANYYTTLAKSIEKQQKLCIEEPSSPNEARPFKLAKTLYRTCLNTTAIENAGLEPLRNIFRQFGNWPVIEGDTWQEYEFTWVESVHKSRKLGYSINNFITFGYSVDWADTTKYIFVLDQPALGLPREYLMAGLKYSVVQAYYNYMVDIAVLLGANRPRAALELKESLDFEIELANITLPKERRQNFTLLYNPMTIADIGKRFPSVNWEEYINKLLPPTIQVNADEVITVRELNFITELEKLLRITPKRVQANYALWRVAAESVKYLTENLRNREAQYSAEIMNTVRTTSNPRWKECMSILSKSTLSLGTNALYVRKYFKETDRQKMVEMVTDIKNEVIKTLEKVDWMDDVTRRKAVEKAAAIISLMAYPVELLDDNELEKLYANLTLGPNDFLGNILELNIMNVDYSHNMIKKPVNRSDWVTHDASTQINAAYDPAENNINIPASILQQTFYGTDRPRYMNYGAIGFIIGHEFTHSYGNFGRQFAKDGSLVDWWTPETTVKYFQKAQCVIDQYSNYTVQAAGANVNGVVTVGENIADNGGVKKAYHAYKEYVKRNGPEPRLPGLKYTPEQMFWISAASIWCNRYRPESAASELTTDVHSPARFRVIGSFSNAPEFAADFNCSVGSYMNPVHKCSVL